MTPTRGTEAPGRPLALVAAGAGIAFVSTMCGIGGGLFAVPLLHFGWGLPLRRAVATGLCLVLANAVASTATQLFHAPEHLAVDLVAALAVGALAGAWYGYRLSRALPLAALRALFVVALAVAGTRMLFPGAPPTPQEVLLESPTVRVGLAFLAGALGGLVAPLLGIGGGLVIVPMLYLGLPSADFAAARAASLATAVVTSGRSLALYGREGAVDRGRGIPLAAGALVGAAAGVVAVHRPGWTEGGRVLLGLVLWLVAARFARDLVRGSEDVGGRE